MTLWEFGSGVFDSDVLGGTVTLTPLLFYSDIVGKTAVFKRGIASPATFFRLHLCCLSTTVRTPVPEAEIRVHTG